MIGHNRKARLNGKEYEIFWVTGYAHHIEKRYSDPSHRVNLIQVEELATAAVFFPYKGELFIGLARFNKKFYKVLAYFSKEDKRCIIKTCNIVNEIYWIKKCQELGL